MSVKAVFTSISNSNEVGNTPTRTNKKIKLGKKKEEPIRKCKKTRYPRIKKLAIEAKTRFRTRWKK